MLNYIYPNRVTNNIQYTSPQYESPIIHNNVSTHAQALIHFHESNLVPDTSSHKRLKLQFNEKPNPTKRTFPNDNPQTLHNKNETKSVTSISSRSRSEAKSVTFDDEEEPTSSFQQRLKQFGTPPQVISPTNHQHILQRIRFITPTLNCRKRKRCICKIWRWKGKRKRTRRKRLL